MVTHVAPPGWPREVRPPDAPDWERTAVNWLLDLCPPEYRDYPAIRRHPVVLARFAVLHVEACHAAVKKGLSEARAELRDVAPLDVVDAAVETWLAEEARLSGVRRAVGLVEEALRGRRYVARLCPWLRTAGRPTRAATARSRAAPAPRPDAADVRSSGRRTTTAASRR